MKVSIIKDEAKKIIDNLPDNVTWEDIIYEMYVRQKIDTGLKDVKEGNIISHNEIQDRFTL
jgi:hypothetical protein